MFVHVLSAAQVDKLDGDASINIRKGKTLLVFDLDVTCKWEGEVKASGKKVHARHSRAKRRSRAPAQAKGTMDFSFTMEDADDFDVQVACDGTADHEDKLKVRSRLLEKCRRWIGTN